MGRERHGTIADVTLTKVDKIYPGNVKAVDDFNLEIADKEFLVLVGPSGCGKSTTLRMIAGLEEITSGEIKIGDRVVNDVPPKDRDIAMVFQNYALYPHMTVFDNMAFGLKLRKYKKALIKERVNEAADILGIGELLDRRPKALSGGQRQRVADPVTLYDEPVNKFVAGFIGTPPMNFFNGRLQASGGSLVFQGGTVSLVLPEAWRETVGPYAGKDVIFGIRPEDLGSPAAEQVADAPRITATIDVIEPMGSESYVHLRSGEHAFISRVDAHRRFSVGDDAGMAVFMGKAHMFDAESEKLIV